MAKDFQKAHMGVVKCPTFGHEVYIIPVLSIPGQEKLVNMGFHFFYGDKISFTVL